MKKEWEILLPLFPCSIKWKRYLEFSSFDLLKFDEGIEFVVTWLIKNSWRKTSLVHLLVLVTKWGQHLLNIGFSLSRFNRLTKWKSNWSGYTINLLSHSVNNYDKGTTMESLFTIFSDSLNMKRPLSCLV